jgi:surfactin synthase thioesterase subunit
MFSRGPQPPHSFRRRQTRVSRRFWADASPCLREDRAGLWLQSGVRAFVLIPGAGGSAWVWSRVTPLLVEAGHEVIAVELPGDDESAGLPRYAELVVDAIGSRPDVVLVAGSLGGFTAPLVCERVHVGELVLVNAMVPAPGETARDWWAHTGALEAQYEAARRGGYGPFDVAAYFLHDVDAEVASEGEPHQRSEADIAFGSVCDFDAWPAVGIRVLAGHDDRFFPVDLQRRVARDRLGVEADVLPGGHLLPLAQPRLVADYLLQTTRLATFTDSVAVPGLNRSTSQSAI